MGIGYIRYSYSDGTSSSGIRNKDKKLSYGKYLIYDKKNILLMYLMLNGNLRLNKRKVQLKRWYDSLNSNLLSLNLSEFNLYKIPELNTNNISVSLEDAWLSGFTDAEGCFSLRVYKQHGKYDYVKISYILDQKSEKNILNMISILFCEKELAKLRSIKDIEDMYRIEISCNDINKDIYKKVIIYFDKYKLKTNKSKSYAIWKESPLGGVP